MPNFNNEKIQVVVEALAVKDYEWILDSSASRHFYKNARLFNSIEPTLLEEIAISAGGQSHPIQDQGSINLSTNGEVKQVSSMYYVPGLNYNLLSVGQIAELGCLIMFDKQKCVVVTKIRPICVTA